MSVCVNKNSAEYQALKDRSGISDFILGAICGSFLEKYGRLPYLDELPNSNSEPYLREKLKINKDGAVLIADVLEATDSNSIEEAIVDINNLYRDLEVTMLPIVDEALVDITHRPTDNNFTPEELERDNIIRNASRDDYGRLLAPNGKVSNLSEELYILVRTKAFKRWFGDWEKLAPKRGRIAISSLFNKNGSVNWFIFEKVLDAYHNSLPDSRFAKGRYTLATREEKHFEGEKNTLNHIKFVTQSMLDLIDGKFDNELPFVSEARANLANQKDLLVLAAMFHDVAKPFRHGDIHGWESADILREIVGTNYDNRLAEWAIRHHMPMPFSHKAEFNLDNEDAIEVAKNIARDALRLGIDKATAINAFVLINAADIINGRGLNVEDNWAKKALIATGTSRYGNDISIKNVLTKELEEKVKLLSKAFDMVSDEGYGNTLYNYYTQKSFDYNAYPEGGNRIPSLMGDSNSISKVVDENGEPLVVYKGTGGVLGDDAVDLSGRTTLLETSIFASNKLAASTYYRENGTFYETFLNIRNPYIVENSWAGRFKLDGKGEEEYGAKFRKLLLLKGYDGILYPHVYDLGSTDYYDEETNMDDYYSNNYLTFYSNQIKSAVGNTGDYSRFNNNIYDEEVNDFIVLNNALEKLASLYGITFNEINSAELATDKWRNIMPDGSFVNAFIYNGLIYINTDRAKVDAPLHEMMHMFIGSIRFTDPVLYQSLVDSVTKFPNYARLASQYVGRTRNDVNEEIFVTEVSKYLMGEASNLVGIDDKIKYEILYNVKRILDTILMGEDSVKIISDERLYDMSLKEIALKVKSSVMTNEFHGTMNVENSELHRILNNVKSDLYKNGTLEEYCD